MKWFAKIFGYIGPAAVLLGSVLPGTSGKVAAGIGVVLTGGAIHAASKTSDS